MKNEICIICKKEYKGFGNNARPLAEGQCCDECNNTKVIPARLNRMSKINREVQKEIFG